MIFIDKGENLVKICTYRVVATQDIQRPLASAFSRNWQRVATTESRNQGPFCFPDRNAAQASYSRSGAFLKRNDASPYRKRVEAYSADYDPGTGGLCRPGQGVPFLMLAACPIDDRCKETLTPLFVGMGLFCPKNP